MGKTRLAAELCLSQQRAGMVAGFFLKAADGAERLGAERLVGLVGHVPVLIVIDEANTRTSELREIIQRLVSRSTLVPVRLLLLARYDGEWRDRLVDDLQEIDLDAKEIAERPFMLPIGAVDDTPAARREAFAEAIAAFAHAEGKSVPTAFELDLSTAMFEAILFVHLAALATLDDEAGLLSGTILPTKLLNSALEREARYWKATASERNLQAERQTIERAVAVATMTTASSEEEAVNALKAIPDIADARAICRPIARWLQSIYSPPITQPYTWGGEGRRWFHPLAPDLLGYTLIAHVLGEVPSLPTQLLKHATGTQTYAALTVLTNAAKAYPEVRVALADAIAKHLPRIWKATLAVAQQTGDPLGLVLDNVMEQNPRLKLATQIEAALPDHTIAMRELAVTVTKQALGSVLEQPPSSERDKRAARLLNNQSMRLADLGRREEALEAIEEAVSLYRPLVQARPDIFRFDLADSLYSQSDRLADLGRREEALEAVEEAVELYRPLAAAFPDAFSSKLAISLNSQSMRLADLGRREEALEAIEEAVSICQPLAVARSDPFLPLAAILHTRSYRLADLGRREEALTAIEETVSLYRPLAGKHPDAFVPDLAISLNSQSMRLADLGRREEALEAIEEAVELYRPLAAARPDAFRPKLADVLHTRSDRLAELGRRQEALTAIEETVSIYRPLVKARPDIFRSDLAGCTVQPVGPAS